MNSLNSILVLRPDRLGDVVLSIPVYESIKRSLPQTKLTVLVRKGSADVLRNNPFIDRVLIFNPRLPWKIFRDLKSETFNLAIVLNQMFSATAATLSLLSGAPWRAGYAHPENTGVFNIRVPLTPIDKPEVEHNLDVLRHLSFPIVSTSPTVYPDTEIENRINTLLKRVRKRPGLPLILIKPGARLSKWRWRIDKFKTLCDKVRLQGLGEILLIKGPGEETLIENFLSDMESPPEVLPKLNIGELASVMRKADLLVCNHTGVMHIASAVKTPIAAIFKHGDILRWGPYEVPHVILEERDSDELSPETVFEKMRDLLKKPLRRTHNKNPA